MPRIDKIQDEKGQKHGPRKGKPAVQVVLLGVAEAELVEYGKSPPQLAKYTPPLRFSEALSPGWSLLRRTSPACPGEQSGWGPPKLADTDAGPAFLPFHAIRGADVQDSLQLWHPTDSPRLEEPHTAGCS